MIPCRAFTSSIRSTWYYKQAHVFISNTDADDIDVFKQSDANSASFNTTPQLRSGIKSEGYCIASYAIAKLN